MITQASNFPFYSEYKNSEQKNYEKQRLVEFKINIK